MIPADAITGGDMQHWFGQLLQETEEEDKQFQRIVQLTNRAGSWSREAAAQIRAANDGDEDARWIVGLVLIWKLNR